MAWSISSCLSCLSLVIWVVLIGRSPGQFRVRRGDRSLVRGKAFDKQLLQREIERGKV